MKRLLVFIVLFGLSCFVVRKTAEASQPTGNFDGVSSDYALSGWTYDPDEPSKSLSVHVYIDGETGSEGLLIGSTGASLARTDVNNTFGITGNHGFKYIIPEKYRLGYHTFYLYAIDSQGGTNPLILGSPKTMGIQPNGNAQISKNIYGSPLVISTFQSLGGAIGSLTWKGVEFIDRADHGRELQTACHFDGYGECYNPTEAGSASDGVGTAPSSSQLQYLSTSDGILHTRARMAYWLRPGERSAACPAGSTALNSSRTSKYVLDKQVEIGYQGLENVIRYDVTIEMPESRQQSVFEILTGYMPTQFDRFYAYNLNTKQIKQIGAASSDVPVIFATADSQLAMGIYTPRKQLGVLNTDYWAAYYSTTDYRNMGSNVMKWNTVVHIKPAPMQDKKWRNYVVVGTVDQVKASMDKLYMMEDGYVVPTASPTPIPPKVTGDANGDSKVNMDDFAWWKKEFVGVLTTKTADFSGDGKVGMEDFGIWKKAFVGM